MPHQPIAPRGPADAREPAFAGFAPPTSNTTYCPNQFFDVCLPHYPRGVVRLVAYLIRKTLGWSDAHGRPQAERHAVSYAELAGRAGISRDMIRATIDRAVQGQFIRCVRQPQPKRAGRPGVTGLYELRWDEEGGTADYVKDPKRFRGFFAGEGNRTYVPNQFFDLLVPGESLAVLKVVGSVVRFSIGFQTKWGHRRRNVALSFQHIQNYAHLRDRKTLSDAVRHALNGGYIERVEAGYFDPGGGRQSRAAVYALRWLESAADHTVGRKTPPAESELGNGSENPTGIGQKTQPVGRSEIPTGIEITETNNTSKQQPTDAAAAHIFQMLTDQGFDAKAARAIGSGYPPERIERQVRWIGRRKVRSNRLGMLRASIEQDWPEPGAPKPHSRPRRRQPQLGEPNPNRPSGLSFAQSMEQVRRRLLTGPAVDTSPGPNPSASSARSSSTTPSST